MVITEGSMLTFKCLYKDAVKKKQDSFEFKGQTVLTDYAKYVIELYSGGDY